MSLIETPESEKTSPKYLGKKKGRWFRLLSLALIGLMMLALIVVGVGVWNSIELKSKATLPPHAESLSQIMSRFLVFQEQVLTDTVEKIDLNTVNSRLSQGTITELSRVSKQMKAVAVLDKDNNVIVSEGLFDQGDWSPLFADQIMTAPSIGIPFRMSSFGDHYLPLRAPILDSRGRLIGALVAAYQVIGPDGIWNESVASLANTRVILSNDQGLIYASFPEQKSFLQSFGTATIDNTLLQQLSKLKAGLVSSGSIENADEDFFYSAIKVENYNSYVIASIPSNSLWGLWLTEMEFSALVIFGVALLGFLVLRISNRRAYLFEEEKDVAQTSVSKLSRAIEQSPSSVIVTDNRWVTEYANRKLLDGSGQIIEIAPNSVLVENKPHDLLKPDIEKILSTLDLGENWYCERCDESQQQWFSFSISKMSIENDVNDSFIIITQNITERKKVEAKLYQQAHYDSLTGLPNRRNSSVLLQKELANARKVNGKVALVYLDLDNFKSVNDRYGHAIGDQLLQAVARRLGQVMYKKGTACHMSGDEFLAFLPYVEKEDIISTIDAAIESITSPIKLEGKELLVTVSMGVSRFPEDCIDETSMLKNADIALYFSKDAGRNCYSFFNEELEKRNERKLELESEVRNALENNELYMVYQTKNKISDYTECSFEALKRWQSPKLGFVGPDEFITAAESIGAIQKMGEFALYQACKDLKKFQMESDQPLTMAVNLSMRQLNNDDIVTIVKDVLESEQIIPERLELEITETLLAESFDIVLPILNKLLDLGVSLSIDDFGTGYSSLNYLTRFPVNTLKVDRCFITEIVNKDKDAALTESVILMAHRLGLKVVAEGIEDNDQIQVLQKFGCDIGQGYFYTKPIKTDDMIVLLQNQKHIISQILAENEKQDASLIVDNILKKEAKNPESNTEPQIETNTTQVGITEEFEEVTASGVSEASEENDSVEDEKKASKSTLFQLEDQE
jgi:diguanylate cyclase (GGDEF)-like protein